MSTKPDYAPPPAQPSVLAVDPALLQPVEQRRRAELGSGLSTLFGAADAALLDQVEATGQWVRLRRGERLFAQGDPGDGLFLLLAGRLRAVLEDGGGERVLGDVAAGESVGEMAFFTGEPRSASVYGLRDSVLLQFSNEAFQRLLQVHPRATANVARLVIERYRRSYRPPPPALVTNVALLPAGPGVDLDAFARGLEAALETYGPTLRVDAGEVDERLQSPGAARCDEADPRGGQVMGWMDEQERANRFVVYRADAGPTPWTLRCVRQADHVLIVGDAEGDPSPGAAERMLGTLSTALIAPRRTLVLLHREDAPLPGRTARWLAERAVDEHRHLRGTGEAEMARIGRMLAGRAVGVVLGGGGARGFAHIGVLRALREAGIPIDMVGGTSMGGAMAAQCAMGWGHEQMLPRNRAAFVDLRAHREFTLPLFSIIRGRKARQMAKMLYGDTAIEDLWIPYFCVSADITRAEMRVHRAGPLGLAASASASLPGVIVPVIEDGHLLVDGALLNNVPADVMRGHGAGVVIVVDVSTEDDMGVACEEFPSPWGTLWRKLLRRPTVKVPGLMEMLVRSSLLASASRARLTRQQADFYLAPPLAEFGMMEFEALERTAEIGYTYAREAIAQWGGAEAVVAHGA